MKSNLFLQFITGCLLLFATVCRAESLTTDEALDFARVQGQELLMSFQDPDLKERFDKLDKLFLDYVDVDYISRFVAGRHWRNMDEGQKKKYKELFLRYGLAYYKTLPLDYAKSVKYQIKGAEADGDFVNVITNVEVSLGQDPQVITLSFRLHKVGGVVKAVDVKIAESSMLLAYRSKFQEMIAQSDNELEWFLEDFEDLVQSLEKNLGENKSQAEKALEFE